MVMLKIDPCDHYHRDDTIDDIHHAIKSYNW